MLKIKILHFVQNDNKTNKTKKNEDKLFYMKKTTKHNSKKATAKPSGRKKMAVKALKNDKKNKFIQEKFNSFQEMFPVLSYD